MENCLTEDGLKHFREYRNGVVLDMKCHLWNPVLQFVDNYRLSCYSSVFGVQFQLSVNEDNAYQAVFQLGID